MDSGVERQKYFKALAAQRARHTFRADGACRGRGRLEEFPAFEFASRIGVKASPCELHG
jgi:hypothetical protein